MSDNRRVRIAPEGLETVRLHGFISLLTIVLAFIFGNRAAKWIMAVALLWILAVLHFFRDPERHSPQGNKLIISPADGRILSVSTQSAGSLLPGGKRITIFMSPLNVHVNRSPVKGRITDVRHYCGKFLSAYKPEAERENERTVIRVNTNFGEVVFSQVAGFLARRIVFLPKVGDLLEPGQRVGMIKFGSRVDVYLPDSASIRIKAGQKVVSGETILGEFSDA